MNGFFPRSLRLGAGAMLLAFMPAMGSAAIVPPRAAMQSVGSDFAYGPIKFHPKQILLSISLQNTTTAKFKVSQKGNTKDRFRGVIGCALNVGKKPRVKISGDRGTILFGRTGIPLGTNFICQVTVLGEGGVTGILPVYVTVGL